MVQNPAETTFKNASIDFPEKLTLGLNDVPNIMNERIQGLEQFIQFFLQHADIINRSSLDALFAFLEVIRVMCVISNTSMAYYVLW